MASKIEKIANRIQNHKEEIEKRRLATDQLQAEIDDLDRQRDQAIDQGDLDKVEALTRRRADMMIKLDARRAIDARKAQNGVSKQEIIDAWNSDCKDYQKRVTDAENELIQKLVEAAYLSKQLAFEAAEADKARNEAMMLAGDNTQAPGYNYPKYNTNLFRLDYLRKDPIKSNCPGVYEFITQNTHFLSINAINWMNL